MPNVTQQGDNMLLRLSATEASSTKFYAIPTDPFTISEFQNMSYDVFERHKIHWFSDCKAQL